MKNKIILSTVSRATIYTQKETYTLVLYYFILGLVAGMLLMRAFL